MEADKKARRARLSATAEQQQTTHTSAPVQHWPPKPLAFCPAQGFMVPPPFSPGLHPGPPHVMVNHFNYVQLNSPVNASVRVDIKRKRNECDHERGRDHDEAPAAPASEQPRSEHAAGGVVNVELQSQLGRALRELHAVKSEFDELLSQLQRALAADSASSERRLAQVSRQRDDALIQAQDANMRLAEMRATMLASREQFHAAVGTIAQEVFKDSLEQDVKRQQFQKWQNEKDKTSLGKEYKWCDVAMQGRVQAMANTLRFRIVGLFTPLPPPAQHQAVSTSDTQAGPTSGVNNDSVRMDVSRDAMLAGVQACAAKPPPPAHPPPCLDPRASPQAGPRLSGDSSLVLQAQIRDLRAQNSADPLKIAALEAELRLVEQQEAERWQSKKALE